MCDVQLCSMIVLLIRLSSYGHCLSMYLFSIIENIHVLVFGLLATIITSVFLAKMVIDEISSDKMIEK